MCVTVKRIQREPNYCGPDFSSPTKQYNVSRRCVLLETFDRETIKRRMYQLYEAKKDDTLWKLLVTKFRVKTSFQALFKAIMEHGISAFMYVYSAWLLFCAVSLLHIFVDTEEHHRRLHYVSSEVLAEIVHQNADRCNHS